MRRLFFWILLSAHSQEATPQSADAADGADVAFEISEAVRRPTPRPLEIGNSGQATDSVSARNRLLEEFHKSTSARISGLEEVAVSAAARIGGLEGRSDAVDDVAVEFEIPVVAAATQRQLQG